MAHDNTRLVFAGRLAEEKWFADALALFDVLVSDDANVTLFVCGDGPLASILRARSDVSFVGESVSSFDFDSISPGRIYSFGWREENEMREVIARSEYALLPSRFVETFGLAALECLRLGVPVIGPRLGGLAAFIPESLAIDLNDPIRLSVDRIREIIRGQIGRDEVSASWRAEIVAHHSRKAWLSTVAHHVLGRRDGRILLVSDYDAPIGWVERHIETIRTALSEAGYEVRVFGKRPKSIPIGRIERIIDMLGTFAAGWGYAALREELGLFAPDAVWLHSCTKTYGLDSVKMLAGYRGRRIFTYHDFSLFSPFASRMRSLSDVPDTWTLSAYLATLGRTHIIERFYLRLKFRKISSIQHELARFDRHVVPSEFMTDFVRRFIGVPESRIQTLPHFLPERPE